MTFTLDRRRTALVVIDPQQWTLGLPLAPYSGEQVVAQVRKLIAAVRPEGLVLLTRVAFSEDQGDRLRAPVDVGLSIPAGGLTAQSYLLHPAMEEAGVDMVLTKRQWSAFYGTELDLQLRRRGIETIVLAGVATTFGVESTARDAWQHNYAVVVAHDACSALGDMHAFSLAHTLPRVARVRSTEEIVAALRD